MTPQHAQELATIRSELRLTRMRLEEAHASELESLSAAHATSLSAINAEHADAIAALPSGMDAALQRDQEANENRIPASALREQVERLEKELAGDRKNDDKADDDDKEEELRKALASVDELRDELDGTKNVSSSDTSSSATAHITPGHGDESSPL